MSRGTLPVFLVLLGLGSASASSTRPAHLESVRIHAEEFDPGGVREAAVYGDGIAILRDEAQIQLQPEEVRRLLAAFEEAGFAGMPPTFGAGKKHLLRRASLRADGVSKEVVQLFTGPTSPALSTLVDRILATVEARSGSGVTASGLSDGLSKVASGAVAPEAFRLQVHRKPRDPKSDAGGYLLDIEEGVATTRSYARQSYAEPVSVQLGRERLAKLASALAAHEPESLPINVYAPEYLEVRLSVLNWKKSVLALPFAGTTRASKGEAQARFDDLAAELDALQAEVLAAAPHPPSSSSSSSGEGFAPPGSIEP